jgi:hypothetical protein
VRRPKTMPRVREQVYVRLRVYCEIAEAGRKPALKYLASLV